ncbi:hypothetical protein GWK47_052067 [Chionoecetes opilio]|uniref:Uncharacterized protein n=1 Tax=Chionoecetes opilio TaxID=41210 RepID=A0A8J4Y0D8_CHIOP|nr:hypothetical protein GWK47_052067 [Chionoecetes opilio]
MLEHSMSGLHTTVHLNPFSMQEQSAHGRNRPSNVLRMRFKTTSGLGRDPPSIGFDANRHSIEFPAMFLLWCWDVWQVFKGCVRRSRLKLCPLRVCCIKSLHKADNCPDSDLAFLHRTCDKRSEKLAPTIFVFLALQLTREGLTAIEDVCLYIPRRSRS